MVSVREIMDTDHICVVVPTYNNAGTIIDVITRIHEITDNIIIVNDGCTDNTADLIEACSIEGITIIDYGHNRGKGYALRAGFRKAREMGYRYAVTVDADGQHFPEDLPVLIHAHQKHPDALLVGLRTLNPDNMRRGSSFANKFSNFWFRFQTGCSLSDTQSGYRLYPLESMGHRWPITNRYESELEFLVFAAWTGVEVLGVPIRVYYPPKEERVSSFRPVYDFSRISILNTILTLIALVAYWPWHILSRILGLLFTPLLRWMTMKGGRPRQVPITLRRLVYSLWSLLFFLAFVFIGFQIFSWFYFLIGRDSEEKRLRYHKMLQRSSHFIIRHVPGVTFSESNKSGEDFTKPAVIICNHQSHLDLMCLLQLTPKIVFVTNDWVWKNPLYGYIIRRAEYYPVSDGLEKNMARLTDLYHRGYSICIFPEGTRSEDCSILRFHKGAFYLARILGADLLPVFIHGVGHVLPKRDFMLREGSIYVEVAPRLSSKLPDENITDDNMKDRIMTRKTRKYYQEHYAEICQRLENDQYWAPYRKYERIRRKLDRLRWRR